jgi:hypothetical protein
LVSSKIQFVYALTGAKAGVDILGVPQTVPLSFFRRAIGYEFPWLGSTRVFSGWIVLYLFVVNVMLVAAAFATLARSKVGLAALIFPGFLLFYAIQPIYVLSKGEPGNYYVLLKTLLLLQPFLPIMLAYCFRVAGNNSLLPSTIGAICAVNFVVHVLVLGRSMVAFNNLNSFHGAAFSREVVSTISPDGVAMVLSDHQHVVQYWGNVLSWNRTKLKLLTNTQQRFIYRSDLQAASPEVAGAVHQYSASTRVIGIAPISCQWFDGTYSATMSAENCRLLSPPAARSSILLRDENAVIMDIRLAKGSS